ncbi:MAG: tetratricopeptide repeat protein [Elusimicrobia bacterium]|nr:tetratricopeptide repeat protein [Elusimicrobiota bacterium]
MKFIFLFSCFILAGLRPPAFAAPEQAENAKSEQLEKYYDTAFEYYCAKNYQKAIEQWDLALKLDPGQVTARNMIADAREKLSKSSDNVKPQFYKLIAKGGYGDALLKLEELLATDATNPAFLKLQRRLKKVNAIVKEKPSRSKSWTLAVNGLASYITEKEDLRFTYDSLRYSRELSPGEARFSRLLAVIDDERPDIKMNDTKPATMGILEHKKDVALHYIYDSKFYLAVKELQSVLRLEPGDFTALKRLGSVHLQLKDYAQAKRTWQKALKISPEDQQLKDYIAALNKI